jgi:hypothetical protein
MGADPKADKIKKGRAPEWTPGLSQNHTLYYKALAIPGSLQPLWPRAPTAATRRKH